jgi:hypothetical protein
MKTKSTTRSNAAAGRVKPVPQSELTQFKRAIIEQVVKPMKERAVTQRDNVARARARYVR